MDIIGEPSVAAEVEVRARPGPAPQGPQLHPPAPQVFFPQFHPTPHPGAAARCDRHLLQEGRHHLRRRRHQDQLAPRALRDPRDVWRHRRQVRRGVRHRRQARQDWARRDGGAADGDAGARPRRRCGEEDRPVSLAQVHQGTKCADGRPRQRRRRRAHHALRGGRGVRLRRLDPVRRFRRARPRVLHRDRLRGLRRRRASCARSVAAGGTTSCSRCTARRRWCRRAASASATAS